LASFGALPQVWKSAVDRPSHNSEWSRCSSRPRGSRTRVRVSKIGILADDLALALAAPRIRIQAPVPGHSYVGIEVPNDEMTLGGFARNPGERHIPAQ